MLVVQRLHLFETIAYDGKLSFIFAMGLYAANDPMSLRNVGHLGGAAFMRSECQWRFMPSVVILKNLLGGGVCWC